jgi:argininosuccinate lyase
MHRSIEVDWILWPYDLQGSRARLEILLRAGLLSREEGDQLARAMDELQAEISGGEHAIAGEDEDVHGWLERLLCAKLGPLGAAPHSGRSRNEQILLDVKLFLIGHAEGWMAALRALLEQLKELERSAADVVMPGYTHLQRAQPLFLRQYWRAHRHTWTRRLKAVAAWLAEAREECPMGAGAINGSTLGLDHEAEAHILGFRHACESPLAMVSLRSEWFAYAALTVHWMLEVSRLLEDLILWNTAEFSFIRLNDSVTTGSSMMPHKRNPDLCELLRGKTSTALGQYTGLLGLTKGLPSGYMKDLQEDKPLLFALCRQLDAFLLGLPAILAAVEIRSSEMEKAAADPLLLATDLMEFLLTQGVPLRRAHHQVAEWVAAAPNQGGLEKLARSQLPHLPADFFETRRSCRLRERGSAEKFMGWKEPFL